MSTLFDGIAKMTDDEIRMQIAFLKNITLMNVAKETGNKVLGGLADIANAFTEAFSKKTPFDYQAKKVSDMVRADYDKMRVNDRIQLEYELVKALKEKCNDLNSDMLKVEGDNEISKERLSFIIVNEAAKSFAGIEKYLTCANKIEQIRIEYNNAFINSLHNYLIKQEKDDVIRVDKQIQERLNEVSMETKRELQKALLPKEFSGRGIGRILRLEKGTKYLKRTVMYLGADCFDMVEVNVETSFAAVKGLKRVSRFLLAQFVWKVAESYSEKFAVDKLLLPSYITADKLQEHYEAEKDMRGLLADRVEALKKLDLAEKQITKINTQIEETSDRLELEQRDYEEIQMQFMSLESKKDVYMSGSRPDNETKSYYNQVNEKKRQLDRAEADLKKQRSRLAEIELKKNTFESEKNVARINYEVVKSKTDNQVSKKSGELELKWTAFFYKFKFRNDLFENLIIQFMDSELLLIEEALKELHDSGDMKAYCYKIEKNFEEVNDTQKDVVSTSEEIVNAADEEYGLDGILKQKFDIDENIEEIRHADAGDQLYEQTSQNTEDIFMITYCNVSSGKNAVIKYKENEIISIERML